MSEISMAHCLPVDAAISCIKSLAIRRGRFGWRLGVSLPLFPVNNCGWSNAKHVLSLADPSFLAALILLHFLVLLYFLFLSHFLF